MARQWQIGDIVQIDDGIVPANPRRSLNRLIYTPEGIFLLGRPAPGQQPLLFEVGEGAAIPLMVLVHDNPETWREQTTLTPAALDAIFDADLARVLTPKHDNPKAEEATA